MPACWGFSRAQQSTLCKLLLMTLPPGKFWCLLPAFWERGDVAFVGGNVELSRPFKGIPVFLHPCSRNVCTTKRVCK